MFGWGEGFSMEKIFFPFVWSYLLGYVCIYDIKDQFCRKRTLFEIFFSGSSISEDFIFHEIIKNLTHFYTFWWGKRITLNMDFTIARKFVSAIYTFPMENQLHKHAYNFKAFLFAWNRVFRNHKKCTLNVSRNEEIKVHIHIWLLNYLFFEEIWFNNGYLVLLHLPIV